MDLAPLSGGYEASSIACVRQWSRLGCSALALLRAQARGRPKRRLPRPPSRSASAAEAGVGHPDLEGIWTSDDMRGVPMSRPPQFGSRQAHGRGVRAACGAAQQGTRLRQCPERHLPERGGVARLRLHVAGHRPAGRPRPGADAGGPGAAGGPRYQRRGSIQHRRGLQQLRPLHHARPGGLVAAGGLRQRRADHADSGLGHHRLRDGARYSRHPARRPAAHRRRHSAADGRFARPLGRQHARHRDDQLHRSDLSRSQRRRPQA